MVSEKPKTQLGLKGIKSKRVSIKTLNMYDFSGMTGNN